MVFCCGGLSDIGNFRENNEDSIVYAQKTIGEVPVCFAAVCDGVGGMRNGEIASQLLSEHLKKWFDSIDDYSGDFSELSNALLQLVNKINIMIIEKSKLEDIQTGSTIAAVLIAGNNYVSLNVGDSRIYHVHKDVIQLSNDDVVVVETKDNKYRTKLSQCIGYSNNIYVNTVFDTIKVGEAFIICSDGLYKRITPRRLKDSVKWVNNEKKCCKKISKMIDFVKRKGEHDNISAVIIKCIGTAKYNRII